MPLRINFTLFTFICLFQSFSPQAQTMLPEYSVINYNSDNALPQNSINDMAFDQNGFLWLATGMGVVRFDGRNFREYNRGNSPALLSDRCSLIGWNKTSGRMLIEPVFDSHRFLTISDDYQLKVDSQLSATPYQSPLHNNEVFYFPALYKKWGEGNTAAFNGLFDRLDLSVDLYLVNRKHAYVRKDKDYYYLDENTVRVSPLTALAGHTQKITFLVGDVYFCIDRQNRLFAYKQGVLQHITGSDHLMKLMSQVVDAIGPYPIQAALQTISDSSHTFLVHKGDIFLFKLTAGMLDLDTVVANTPIRDINCLIYDRRYKILYIGTATSGLYILKKKEFQRLFFSSDNYAINSLYGQVELPHGEILTSSGILNRNSPTNIPTPGMYDRAAFLKSSDGHIWYSSYGWLTRTDTTLRDTARIASLGNISHYGIWVTSFVETRDKDILYSTLKKLYRLRGKTATLLLDSRVSMNNAEIMVISLVNEKELWIGTDKGLYAFDLEHKTICQLHGLEKVTVRSIYKAHDGGIWIGTYGQGFYKYVRGGFLRMPMDRGNNLSNVHCFMEDRQGYFWLPTNKGLYRVPKYELDSFAAGGKDEVDYYYFDRSAGFRSNEFNGGCTPCGIITSDGRFSLPSLDGLIQFQPDSITMMLPDHPIFIDHQDVDSKRMASCDHFDRDQDAGPLVFSIASPYYGNPANLHLEYSIPELDDRWHPVNADGSLVLTGLHKGRYTLTIRKQEGYARYSCKVVHWTIRPYWYESLWFRLLAALVLISILPVIFYLRYTRQVRRAEYLEQKVAERTEALSENNRVKEKMIAIILHDLRSPLRFLHMLATHIYESYQQVTRPELDDMLHKFQTATRDLYQFAQDFVVWTNAQKEGFVVKRERINLREIVDEIVSLYEPGADIRNNTVGNLVPETTFLVSDPHILKLLIRNLTDNANKYTLNGEITIQAVEDGTSIRITIADTGRSMEKELVEAILNNTYQSNDESSGFGYKIILELLTRIKGRLEIVTPDTGGNRVTLIFQKRGNQLYL